MLGTDVIACEIQRCGTFLERIAVAIEAIRLNTDTYDDIGEQLYNISQSMDHEGIVTELNKIYKQGAL